MDGGDGRLAVLGRFGELEAAVGGEGARIRSARSATSFAGTGSPMNVSVVMSCPRCAGV